MNSFSTSFKALVIVAVLSTLNVSAMNQNTQPKAPAAPQANVKNDCGVTCAITKTWNKVSTEVASQTNKIVAGAKEMKAKGWSQLQPKEKAGVVIGGTLVAATAAYLVYKVYKSFTAPKVKRSPRA